MVRRRRRRVAAVRQAKETPLQEIVELEHKVEKEITREVEVARHALDRMQFWGGMSLLTLSVVLSIHGVAEITYLSTALAGMLAMVFE